MVSTLVRCRLCRKRWTWIPGGDFDTCPRCGSEEWEGLSRRGQVRKVRRGSRRRGIGAGGVLRSGIEPMKGE